MKNHPRAPRAALLAALPAVLLCMPAPAAAQELTQTFINPSFGGNPFYSDHLLAIAGLDRPAEPEEPEEDAPTSDELLASQLRAQLTSSLSSDILRAIQTANTGPFVPGAPGNTGTFVLGDQRISFVRTATETRVTFVNGRTGETSEVVIPATSTTEPSLGAGTRAAASAEQLLTTQSSTARAAPGRSASTRDALAGRVALFGTPLGPNSTQASTREGLLLAPPPLQ